MRRFVFVSLASLMMGSAFALPAENSGEHTYSYQGKAVRVNVVSRSRNIPAPSSWTPPERIKLAPVQVVLRDQPKKIGGTGFTSPSFSKPSFSNPSFSNPSFSKPGFSNPGFSNPGFSNPGFSKPGYSNPTL
ncbi:hypothetical protein IV102_02470 [bacterium]|nr:hypothetical protein [bacterium]